MVKYTIIEKSPLLDNQGLYTYDLVLSFKNKIQIEVLMEQFEYFFRTNNNYIEIWMNRLTIYIVLIIIQCFLLIILILIFKI